MIDFSQNLRDVVQNRGMSQQELARKVGTTEATISRYMTGINKPNVEIVAKIAEVLQISVDYLLGLSSTRFLDAPPEFDVQILVNAYYRADEDHKNIIWSVLDSYLTPAEKESILAMKEKSAKAV